MLPLVNPLCGSDLGNLSVTFFNCYSFCLAPDQEIQGLYLRRAEAAEDVNNANHLLSRAGTMHRKCHLRLISMGNCVSAVGCRMKLAKCPHGIVEVNKGVADLKTFALEIPDQHFAKRFLLEMDVLTLLTMEAGASLAGQAQNGACVCGGLAASPGQICDSER